LSGGEDTASEPILEGLVVEGAAGDVVEVVLVDVLVVLVGDLVVESGLRIVRAEAIPCWDARRATRQRLAEPNASPRRFIGLPTRSSMPPP
jgi:hypothetical protein